MGYICKYIIYIIMLKYRLFCVIIKDNAELICIKSILNMILLNGGKDMAVTYRKLWHMLIDRKMKKKELQAATGLTHYAMLKLSRDEDVTTETLRKICKVLEVNVEDIMEFIPED